VLYKSTIFITFTLRYILGMSKTV